MRFSTRVQFVKAPYLTSLEIVLTLNKIDGLGPKRVIVAMNLMVFEPVPRETTDCTRDQKWWLSALPEVIRNCTNKCKKVVN